METALVRPVASWYADRDRRYAEHLASLDALYFARGQQHLDGLMAWAQGRIQRERSHPLQEPPSPPKEPNLDEASED